MNILKRSLLIVSLLASGLTAQDKVDAIEAARQAKAAAEKAALMRKLQPMQLLNKRLRTQLKLRVIKLSKIGLMKKLER
jgi:hypothetical protein